MWQTPVKLNGLFQFIRWPGQYTPHEKTIMSRAYKYMFIRYTTVKIVNTRDSVDPAFTERFVPTVSYAQFSTFLDHERSLSKVHN